MRQLESKKNKEETTGVVTGEGTLQCPDWLAPKSTRTAFMDQLTQTRAWQITFSVLVSIASKEFLRLEGQFGSYEVIVLGCDSAVSVSSLGNCFSSEQAVSSWNGLQGSAFPGGDCSFGGFQGSLQQDLEVDIVKASNQAALQTLKITLVTLSLVTSVLKEDVIDQANLEQTDIALHTSTP